MKITSYYRVTHLFLFASDIEEGGKMGWGPSKSALIKEPGYLPMHKFTNKN